MRTQEEILARIEKRKGCDPLGFEWTEYTECLTFENAKQFLKPDVTADQWKTKSTDDIRKEAIEYMPFAWEKANNCRGISAWRSLAHYIAWLWLLGEDDFDDLEEYEFYGKPHLIRICDYFGLDASQWDDGRRVNTDE